VSLSSSHVSLPIRTEPVRVPGRRREMAAGIARSDVESEDADSRMPRNVDWFEDVGLPVEKGMAIGVVPGLDGQLWGGFG
jgi:hypothetical protein